MAALISYPLDTVRRRLMMQSGQSSKEYKNAWSCAKVILFLFIGLVRYLSFFIFFKLNYFLNEFFFNVKGNN